MNACGGYAAPLLVGDEVATGDNVNDLTPNVGDPNSWIPEYKAFLVNLEPVA